SPQQPSSCSTFNEEPPNQPGENTSEPRTSILNSRPRTPRQGAAQLPEKTFTCWQYRKDGPPLCHAGALHAPYE
ncbi:hypothetical protein, partial [Oerskovia douganii]|uniref:hypothetical protein n=1 Tax=Oerskovia douganii TaxID=2762210 RepID=UPI001D1036F7